MNQGHISDEPRRDGTDPRVLVVRGGNEHLDTIDLVEEIASDRTEVADDIYEAVAIAGLATTSDPIETVLVPVTIPEFSATRIVDAFETLQAQRRIRLVLMVPTGRNDAMDSAIVEGFDDAIEVPTTPGRLRRALGASDPSPVPQSPPGQATPPRRPDGFDQSGNKPGPGDAPERLDARTPSSPRQSESLRSVDPEELEAQTRAIGDIDLVMSITENDGSFRGIALTMIRAHLGTGDVHLLLPGEFDPEEARTSSQVMIDQDHVATLVSSTVGRKDLERWAEWLAIWMGLERRMRALETLTETDELTNAGNRRAFERVLSDTLDSARQERRIVTVMVFDIDNFKTYNDRYGHDAGDEVLRQTVDLLRSTIRRGDHVFRIGGDEFVVIFSDPEGPRNERSAPPESVEDIAHRFQTKVCEMKFPQLGVEAEGSLSISAGLATFPWDGHDGQSLLRHADQLAMDSKRNGKNAIRFGPGARDFCKDCDDDAGPGDPTS